MGRIKAIALYMGYLGALALGGYEVVAKSDALPWGPLPGWQATCAVERMTRWRRPTGCLPVDRLLHEGQEALAYYGLRGRENPSSAALSSRSASSRKYAS